MSSKRWWHSAKHNVSSTIMSTVTKGYCGITVRALSYRSQWNPSPIAGLGSNLGTSFFKTKYERCLSLWLSFYYFFNHVHRHSAFSFPEQYIYYVRKTWQDRESKKIKNRTTICLHFFSEKLRLFHIIGIIYVGKWRIQISSIKDKKDELQNSTRSITLKADFRREDELM
jgi:hypothetical protein